MCAARLEWKGPAGVEKQCLAICTFCVAESAQAEPFWWEPGAALLVNQLFGEELIPPDMPRTACSLPAVPGEPSPPQPEPVCNLVSPVKAQLAFADPLTGETELRNSVYLRGKVVLMLRGGCTFAEKVQRAWDAGAAAVLIANADPDHSTHAAPFFAMAPPSPLLSPTGAVAATAAAAWRHFGGGAGGNGDKGAGFGGGGINGGGVADFGGDGGDGGGSSTRPRKGRRRAPNCAAISHEAYEELRRAHDAASVSGGATAAAVSPLEVSLAMLWPAAAAALPRRDFEVAARAATAAGDVAVLRALLEAVRNGKGGGDGCNGAEDGGDGGGGDGSGAVAALCNRCDDDRQCNLVHLAVEMCANGCLEALLEAGASTTA
ncbi:unnamed protein product, partial [Phaeothamnion confervicola]